MQKQKLNLPPHQLAWVKKTVTVKVANFSTLKGNHWHKSPPFGCHGKNWQLLDKPGCKAVSYSKTSIRLVCLTPSVEAKIHIAGIVADKCGDIKGHSATFFFKKWSNTWNDKDVQYREWLEDEGKGQTPDDMLIILLGLQVAQW